MQLKLHRALAHVFRTVKGVPVRTSLGTLENKRISIIFAAHTSHMETVLLILSQLVFVAYFVVFLAVESP